MGKAACCSTSWCVSFDYFKGTQECDLSNMRAEDVGGLKTDYDLDPYDHYSLSPGLRAGYELDGYYVEPGRWPCHRAATEAYCEQRPYCVWGGNDVTSEHEGRSWVPLVAGLSAAGVVLGIAVGALLCRRCKQYHRIPSQPNYHNFMDNGHVLPVRVG